MSQWKKVKIGDFLKRKRIPVVLDETAKYKLLTVRLYHKGIVLREEKLGALIKSNMFKVSKGDFILSGIDARNGAFGIVPEELDGAVVTNDFWYFDIDESIIKREYFLWLTTTPIFLDACQKASKGETQRIRLQKEAFFNYEINCPTIDYQDEFLSTIASVIDNINELKKETEKQTELVKQLRASILQDAIEGKLTADWREKHPVKKGDPDYDAEALFEKIQAEKQEKGKKQKHLPAITENEKPFAIPTNWKWVRLGDAAEILGGYAYKSHLFKEEGNNLVLRLGNIRTGYLRYEASPAFVSEDIAKDTASYKILKNDIIVTMTGTRGKRDYLYTLLIDANHVSKYNMFLNQRLANIRSLYSPKYVYDVLQNDVLKEPIFESATGSANQANIGMPALQKWAIPYPPLAEQNEIAARVEKHLETITQLENQIASRETLTKQLMQGLLKDAFEE